MTIPQREALAQVSKILAAHFDGGVVCVASKIKEESSIEMTSWINAEGTMLQEQIRFLNEEVQKGLSELKGGAGMIENGIEKGHWVLGGEEGDGSTAMGM